MGMVGVSTLALVIAGIPQVSRAAADAATNDADTIIVTGTRDVGVKATESPTPIQVIGAEALQATGATNVFDALKDVMPSLSASSYVGDSSELIRTARLRGMNPGETLVLIDGKRRHNSANIVADQSPDVGANPTDLDMIPLSLIDHVEVLLDGAAAQYGSDAVAGVINVILKHDTSGTNVTLNGGVTSRGDGAQGAAGFSQAVKIGNGGFVDVSVDYRHQDFSNRNGINIRTLNSVNGITGEPIAPTRNRLEGSPLSDLVLFGFNGELPINDNITAYGFGTFGHRSAQAYENDRESARAPLAWPLGFFPRETLNEVDGAITGGVKGSHLFGGWDWDLSATYGQDHDHLGLIDSYNTGLSNPPGYAAHPGLGLNTGFTGGTLGGEENAQTTVNADFRRGLNIPGLAAPLNVAVGAEFRYETYSLTPGDPGTYIDGGTQSEAGLTPSDASNNSREVEAVYADLSTKLLPKWSVDLAGRFENYSTEGVGSTENGKLTTRYDVTPQFAVRATASTGFHAPTLAQSNFAVTNVTPTALNLQAPPSSPGGKLLGAPALQPETSKDIDFGVVVEPFANASFTADAYQIFLDKAIINSGLLTGPLAVAAAAANGNAIPAALLASTTATVAFFNNGVDTRTRGVDISADYRQDLGAYGRIKYSLTGNYNEIAITRTYKYAGINPEVITDLTKGAPVNKVTLSANWKIGNLDVTLRETRYGHVDERNSSTTAVVPFSNIYIKSAYISDVDVGYFFTDAIKVDVGGNNVFDHLPGQTPYLLQESSRASNLYPYYTPWGIAGAYFYTRLTASF